MNPLLPCSSTPLHISPLLHRSCSPCIFPSYYTYLHPPPTFLFPPVPNIYSIPCLPPAPPFRLFDPFIAISLLPPPFPTHSYYPPLFSLAFYPLVDPFHPSTPACPPAPISLFFDYLWMVFCINCYCSASKHVNTSLVWYNKQHLTAFL